MDGPAHARRRHPGVGHGRRSRPQQDLGELLRGYGVDDVLSTVFRDGFGCWGFLDLWRAGDTFSPEEGDLLAGLARVATSALRTSLARAFAIASPPLPHDQPAVLLLDDRLEPVDRTPATEAFLRALLPPEEGRDPVPAGAFNVAAQLLAREHGVDHHPAMARTHLHDGLWVTFRAARLARGPAGSARIAVSIEPTPPVERADLYGRVIGLSAREVELLGHLVAGHDTREVARRMYVSQHTVQDHLESIFAKAGVRNRRALVACATGAG